MEGDMTTPGLLRRQWEGYGTYHQDRRNVVVHLVAVPAFMLGNVLALAGAALLSPMLLVAGVALGAGSLAAQGRGHRLEPVPPLPFAGPADFVKRLLAEQWITFPRFVLSGGWRAKPAKPGHPAG
jgi:hypothetical protein